MMKNFRFTIRLKITLLALSGILFLALVGGVAINAVGGLARQAENAVSGDARAIGMLNTLREVQTNFQRQVQEWKDILLRGNDADEYARHLDAFEKRNADVKQGLT